MKNSKPRLTGSVATTLLVVLVLFGVIAAWCVFGFYHLDPGERAVLLRLGSYHRTEEGLGWRFHWPPPLESRQVVNVQALEREEFGFRGEQADPEGELQLEASMQTSDNSIVYVSFVVQYQIGDPVAYLYRVVATRDLLRDAAQAAVREEIGRTSIDELLGDRTAVQDASHEILQKLLNEYYEGVAGVQIQAVQLQDVKRPLEVQEAVDSVNAARQFKEQQVTEAGRYKNDQDYLARQKQARIEEATTAYVVERVLEAESKRDAFLALLPAYQAAPEVTRRRLYLETMENVLSTADTVIIEKGTSNVLPYLPLGDAKAGGAKAPKKKPVSKPPVAADPGAPS